MQNNKSCFLLFDSEFGTVLTNNIFHFVIGFRKVWCFDFYLIRYWNRTANAVAGEQFQQGSGTLLDLSSSEFSDHFFADCSSLFLICILKVANNSYISRFWPIFACAPSNGASTRVNGGSTTRTARIPSTPENTCEHTSWASTSRLTVSLVGYSGMDLLIQVRKWDGTNSFICAGCLLMFFRWLWRPCRGYELAVHCHAWGLVGTGGIFSRHRVGTRTSFFDILQYHTKDA